MARNSQTETERKQAQLAENLANKQKESELDRRPIRYLILEGFAEGKDTLYPNRPYDYPIDVDSIAAELTNRYRIVKLLIRCRNCGENVVKLEGGKDKSGLRRNDGPFYADIKEIIEAAIQRGRTLEANKNKSGDRGTATVGKKSKAKKRKA